MPLGGDAEPGQSVDQGLLQRPQVPMQVLAVVREVDDGIADELTGAVVGHISPTLDLEHLDPGAVRQDVLRVTVATERDDRRMFEQQQHVVREPPRDAVLGEAALPLQRFAVRHAAGVNHLEGAVAHGVLSVS